MTNVQIIRYSIILGGIISGLAAFFVIPIRWLAVTAGILIPLTDIVVADMICRRLADKEILRGGSKDRPHDAKPISKSGSDKKRPPLFFR